MEREKDLSRPLLPKPARGGAVAGRPKAANGNLTATAGAFACFVAVRSFHPIVIDISKTDGRLPYGKATPCVINSLVDIIVGNAIAYSVGGADGLRQCWDPKPLRVFSAIAVVYAIGDFLEMQSMSVMSGAAYQILLQSKLIITALIIWALRGKRQSLLQWNVLLTIVLGMSAFVLLDQGDGDGDGGSSPESSRSTGLFFVVAKVIFSCICAVLAEKYLKEYAEFPIYAQVAQLKFAWMWMSLILTMMFDHDVVQHGFFAGWDWRTVAVSVSWVCKGWTTFLVLKSLDSVLKNIGEAVAIVVIYAFDILIAGALEGFLPVTAKEFKPDVFLVVLVVVSTVLTYTLSSAAPAKQKI